MRFGTEPGLWTLALALGGLAALGIQGAAVPTPDVPAPGPAAPPLEAIDADALATAGGMVVESDPFRLERRPPDPDAGAEVDPSARPTTPVPIRPQLRLSGIIGGPPWEAIVDGIPGHEAGVLVRTGDVLGDVRIVAIGPDSAVVEGADTTWIIAFESREQ